MILFEHAAAAFILWLAVLGALAVVAASFYRHVRRDLVGGVLVGLRLLFVLLLAWCLFMPQLRERSTALRKPRFLIAVDTSASMAQAPTANTPSRWQTVQHALGLPWMSSIRAACETDAYTFAGTLGPRTTPSALDTLTPVGELTRVRDNVERLVDRYKGQNVAGMVLLSDALDTGETPSTWAQGKWPWPIYTLRLEPEGVWEEEPDLRIDSVETPRRVTVGWQTELHAVISGQGTGGRPVHVRLLRDDKLLEELPIRIPREGGRRETSFRLSHDTIGVFTYRVVLPPYPSEAVTNNNRHAVGVQVVDARNRLLYVEGPPRWESKFLTRALRANRQVTPVCFIRGPDGKFFTVGPRSGVTANMTADELALFKIVVLGDLGADELGDQRVANLLSFVDTGGSLLLLGGAKAWGKDGFRATGLSRLLPVKGLDAVPLQERTEVVLTGAGRSHAAFGGGTNVWQSVPPVLSVFAGASLSAGGEVLAQARTTRGEQPLIVAQRYGQGKVVAMLTDSLWRWRMAPDTGDARPYQRFWDQLLAWMSPTADSLDADDVDLFADREVLYLGETIELNARRGAEAGGGETAATVTCDIETPDGRRVPYSMTRQDVVTPTGRTLPGHAVTVTARQPGLHKAIAAWTVSGRRTESDPVTFFVKPFTPEQMPRPSDNAVLRMLARTSDGRFFESAETLNSVLAAATFDRTEDEELHYTSLWQRMPVLACLLLLIAIEWIVRRWRSMP